MKGLDILEHCGIEYRRLVNNAKWTLASLNWAPRFDESHVCELEKHNLTDETFVLLNGKATLLVGEKGDRVEMEPLKYYNVRAGIWHHIVVSEDARVLVAENANTSKDNTEYLSLATGEVFRKYPEFEEVLPDTYLLKVPFGPVWTGIILIKGEKNILIDSSHLEPESYLVPALEKLGMKLSDIDWLLNTHVHGDHIGGMVKDGQAAFTNAVVYLNKDEFDGGDNVAESPMAKAYGDRLTLFTDADVLPCGVKAVKAYGHTPGHTMYRVEDMVIAGDIMHATALQLVNPDSCARFDQDKEQSAQARKDAIASFKAEGLKVYGMHFPDPYYIQF